MNGVLQAAGLAAHQIAQVSWVLFAGGGVIFAGVMLLLLLALRRARQRACESENEGGAMQGRPNTALWLLAGGILFPAVTLAALFAWSLPMSPLWKPVPPAGAMVVTVTGKMWWWDVRYATDNGQPGFRTANEIRIPVGRPVYLALASDDVIHSFWVPALAGKVDMVPGRLQHLLVQATQPGVYRGQCAEFCGAQHAKMALHVVAEPPDAFEAWRAGQLQAARAPQTAQQASGRDVFLAQRCNACHAVRGVSEESRLGPDLTHMGSRLYLAAGTLPAADVARWIAHVQEIKPGARMPSYQRLPAQELAELSAWLESLQ